MHLARHTFSESSNLAPGLVTHFWKHLSVIFCSEADTLEWQTRLSGRGMLRADVCLHHFLDVLCGHLALNLLLRSVDVGTFHDA